MKGLNTEHCQKDFRCDFGNCDKCYRTKFSLKRHYLSHLGVKQHQCPYCEKRFALAQYLSEHVNIHTGEKPFVCSYPSCGRCFRQAGKLSLHKKQHSRLDFSDSDSQSSSTNLIDSNCSFATIEAVFTQIAAYPLPSFFYTRVLPPPNGMALGKDTKGANTHLPVRQRLPPL